MTKRKLRIIRSIRNSFINSFKSDSNHFVRFIKALSHFIVVDFKMEKITRAIMFSSLVSH